MSDVLDEFIKLLDEYDGVSDDFQKSMLKEDVLKELANLVLYLDEYCEDDRLLPAINRAIGYGVFDLNHVKAVDVVQGLRSLDGVIVPEEYQDLVRSYSDRGELDGNTP